MKAIAKILLAEDDKNLGYILKEYLSMHNFDVTLTCNGKEALESFNNNSYDLCILDIMMPVLDGFSVAQEIKKRKQETPLVFLTAKTLKIDKLKGFKIGADDYIVKPVDEEELIARIHAILRRTSNTINEDNTIHFQLGEYFFDYRNQLLTFEDDKQQLTAKEADILRELCIQKGQILDRKKTLNTYWGENDYFNRRSMDVFIYKLRKYLSKDTSVHIKNVHGKGFILDVD
ncbi:response regulator transcription factor [Aquimarina sp. 2201CG5-10]|uniref:response regulator transcription factor n=1 Tax=Aquimarina callyspongiae TaxID=3098150 RepID=UPI002AB56EB2|nr:response regulator transcription factor [Aquimarina sp. 2201CG5-10]MDY8135191.1 response regulator transcription factor [Aquimarina sp. 2201CG5-10]